MRSLRAATKVVARTGLQSVPFAAWCRLMPQQVIALFYHIVSDETLPTQKHYPYKNAAQFEEDVAFCAARGCTDYAHVVRSRKENAKLDPNGFLITFDDGFAECFTVARPILMKHAVSAVFFVTTDVIDNRWMMHENRIALCIDKVEAMNATEAGEIARSFDIAIMPDGTGWQSAIKEATGHSEIGRIDLTLANENYSVIRWLLDLKHHDDSIGRVCERLGIDPVNYHGEQPIYMSEEQIRQLAADGFTIGGHGKSHFPLQRMTAEEKEKEIVESCARIRDITGQKRVPFAFPYGGGGIDTNLLADILSRNDFIELFFGTNGFRNSPSFVVNRTWADFPDGRGGNHTNLPEILRREWLRQVIWT